MAMSRTHRDALAGIREQMRTMSAEMRTFADGQAASAPAPTVLLNQQMNRLRQLQINQTGSWRKALDFDAADLTSEEDFLYHLDQVFDMVGGLKAKVVIAKPGENGGPVATSITLMTWSPVEGWVNT